MLDLVLAFIKVAFSKEADTPNGRALQAFARFVVGMVAAVLAIGATIVLVLLF